jgi:hypothetical protein
MRYFVRSDYPQLCEHPDLLRAREAVNTLLWLLTNSYGLSTEGMGKGRLLRDLLFARIYMEKTFEEDEQVILAVRDELSGDTLVQIGRQGTHDSLAVGILAVARSIRGYFVPRDDGPDTIGTAIQMILDALPDETKSEPDWPNTAIALAHVLLHEPKGKILPAEKLAEFPRSCEGDVKRAAMLAKAPTILPSVVIEAYQTIDRKRFKTVIDEIDQNLLRRPLHEALELEPETYTAQLDQEFARAVQRRKRKEAEEGQREWEFGPGWFRYKTETYNTVTGKNLRLLEAFVKARQKTLTHDNITKACNDDFGSRPAYNYVSELNATLCKLWRLSENPIQPIPGERAYRFNPPSQTSGK